MNNITRLIVRENSRLWFGFSDTSQFQTPMKSEIQNKEEIIKKQIQVIKELNLVIQNNKEVIEILEKVNSGLYTDIKELGQELDSQDKSLNVLIKDWKELKEDCDTQTKEVKKLQDKIKLMGEMNNELQEELMESKKSGKIFYIDYFCPICTNITS